MAMCQISLCPCFKLPCTCAVYPFTLHSMNEINVQNMFPKLGENIYYWDLPKMHGLWPKSWMKSINIHTPNFIDASLTIRPWLGSDEPFLYFASLTLLKQHCHDVNKVLGNNFILWQVSYLFIHFFHQSCYSHEKDMKFCPAKLSFCCCLVNVQVCISHWFYSGFSGWPLTSWKNLHLMSDIQMKNIMIHAF